MSVKEKSSRTAATVTRAKQNLRIYFSTKKRLSKDQKDFLVDLFGAIVMFVTMVLVTMLLLLLGVNVC